MFYISLRYGQFLRMFWPNNSKHPVPPVTTRPTTIRADGDFKSSHAPVRK